MSKGSHCKVHRAARNRALLTRRREGATTRGPQSAAAPRANAWKLGNSLREAFPPWPPSCQSNGFDTYAMSPSKNFSFLSTDLSLHPPAMPLPFQPDERLGVDASATWRTLARRLRRASPLKSFNWRPQVCGAALLPGRGDHSIRTCIDHSF